VSDYTTEMGKDLYNFVRSVKADVRINNRVDKGRHGMMGMRKAGDFAGDFGPPRTGNPRYRISRVGWGILHDDERHRGVQEQRSQL
jgi:alpha-L-fucosidase